MQGRRHVMFYATILLSSSYYYQMSLELDIIITGTKIPVPKVSHFTALIRALEDILGARVLLGIWLPRMACTLKRYTCNYHASPQYYGKN